MDKYSYPKEIQVGGHTLKIMFVDGCSTNSHVHNDADAYIRTGEIRIATKTAEGKDCTISHLNECLLHELIETINEVYSVQITEAGDKEVKIEGIAQGLLQVLSQLGIKLIKEC